MKNPVVPNTPRGCGSLFNETALRAWHDANGIQLTIRYVFSNFFKKSNIALELTNSLIPVFFGTLDLTRPWLLCLALLIIVDKWVTMEVNTFCFLFPAH
jgi:hypothetical protein